MKKILIKTLIVFIGIIIILTINSNVFASDITLRNMEDQTSGFLKTGRDQATDIDYDNIVKPFQQLGSILTFIGAGVMVAVTTYMGIKYLMAGPEAQAKLKIQLIGVVVSGIVIFAAYGIWKITIQIFGNL